MTFPLIEYTKKHQSMDIIIINFIKTYQVWSTDKAKPQQQKRKQTLLAQNQPKKPHIHTT